MNIGIVQLVAGVVGSVIFLAVLGLLLFRRSRPAFPVKCIHCLQYHQTETIVAYSEKPDQWAICPKCVKEYWHLD